MLNNIIIYRNNIIKELINSMYYNFNHDDLQSDQKTEEYKKFAQEVLGNIDAVQEVYQTLRAFNSTATISSTIGNLSYKNSKGSQDKIYATGEIYPADRLRQLIHASKRGEKLAMNIRYQEETSIESDPFITVADMSFEYDPFTQDLTFGEVLTTQELLDLKSKTQLDKQNKDIEDDER